MKKRILIASVIIVICAIGVTVFQSCFDLAYQYHQNQKIEAPNPQIDQIAIGEFSYDGCTYIYVRQQTKDHITHKGNCTNIQHNQNFAENQFNPTHVKTPGYDNQDIYDQQSPTQETKQELK